jgi:RNA polymerase sigma-70 factor (ECF subfamily)
MFLDSGHSALVGNTTCGIDGVMAITHSQTNIPGKRELERDLVAVGKSRDRAAFHRLFEHFTPRLRSFLMRGRAPDGALDDLVQDVMVTIWRRAETYDPAKATASTWIFTVARNRRIDLARRSRPEVDLDDPATVPEQEDHAPLPDEQTSHTQMAGLIRSALDLLPADQSDIVKLAYLKDMSHSEIAEELALPLGTVKSRLRLALGKLRQAMEGLE